MSRTVRSSPDADDRTLYEERKSLDGDRHDGSGGGNAVRTEDFNQTEFLRNTGYGDGANRLE